MTATAETHSFQAETRQLLDLMIHSLYSHREIFLRELISNASDALDKLRIESLTDDTLREGAGEPRIRIELDKPARTLSLDDNGIGMTRDEVIENIGTIARSGTREFAERLASAKRTDGEARAELIGQFGVGFYSSFMVAEEVVLETRRAGTDQAVRWRSHGDGQYTIEECEKATPGTRITLHLRDFGPDDDGEFSDFTDEWTVRSVVRRYSDFVEHPIQMDVEREEAEAGEDEEHSVVRTETLNSRRPLWTRPKAEITEEQHTEFYRHLSHDWSDPLQAIHFKAEGTHEYTALLYLPKQRQPDVLDPTASRSRVALHVKRVFVMADCEELVPPWLRFVRGIVDSADLPLNVSRETLQHARQMGQIRKRLTRKVIDAFGELLEHRRDDYVAFWKEFGPLVKEGLFIDDEHRDDLAAVALFASTHGEAPTTLAEYVERMAFSQEQILYVTGVDRRAVERSPHLEAARKAGREVLLLTDPVDDWVVRKLTEFDGKPLVPVDRGEAGLEESEEQKTEREGKQKELAPVLEAVRKALDEQVKEVRLSARLSESPAVLVGGQGDMTPQMEAILRASGQQVPHAKRILELNPEHPVLARLTALHESAGSGEDFTDFAELLLGQALLAEGSPPPDPARFAKLVSRLMTAG